MMDSFREQPNLPVIDLTRKNVEPFGSTSWVSTRQEVVKALEEHGCFIAIYDKVSVEHYEALFNVSKEAFGLPFETKSLNISDTPTFGYVGQKPYIPLYEALGIEKSTTEQGVQQFTDLLWPSGNQSFSKTVIAYTKFVAALEQMVMRMISESYGIEKHYEPILGATSYLFKMMKYRRPKENETNFGIFPHTDYSMMSILQQHQVGGVHLKTKVGHDIPIGALSPSSFIVMAGDGCMVWTNGRIKSTEHSVIIEEERYSVGLFSFIRDFIIEVPEEVVDDEHPLQYKPFDMYKFIHFIASGYEANKSDSHLKAFCGL